MFSTILAGSTLLGLASAVSIDRRQIATASGFPIPANDSFYAPTNFASLAPGSIIASRQVQTSIQGLLQLANSTVTAQSYQVSYRTTGPAGEPLTAVTTVFVPTPRQANILLAYQSPEDSASINCAPSYWYRSGVNQTGLGQTTAGGDLFAITNILQQGWTVSAADYESNELAAFGIGAIAAHGVLDGIRATLAFNSSGLSRSPNVTKIGLFGYSGGGQATGWAMQSQPSYAPELNIVGAALGGLPANLTADGIYLDGKAGSGFIPIVIASLAKYYTPLRTRLEAILTDAGRAAEALAVNSCTVTMLTRYANQFFINGTTYQTVGASILSDSQIQPYFEAQTVAVNASLVPKAPMYAVHCASDETVAIGPADVAYASWCRLGSAPITYLRDVSGTCSHVTEAGLAYPEFFAFLRGRFNGTAPATSCSVTNRSLSANGSVPALSSFYGSYLNAI